MVKTITVKKGERVPCAACGQHILLKDFGGMAKVNGATVYTHDSLPCLLRFQELTEAVDVQGNGSESQANTKPKGKLAL